MPTGEQHVLRKKVVHASPVSITLDPPAKKSHRSSGIYMFVENKELTKYEEYTENTENNTSYYHHL